MTDSFLRRFVASCEARRGKTAMRIVGDESQVYTFGEMLRAVRGVAFGLKSANIEFGDRVALIGENHPSWAIAYLAILYHGAVCVPLDPNGEIETLTNFLENSEAKIAFIGPEMTEKFARIQVRLGKGIPVVVWGSTPSLESEPGAVATGAFERNPARGTLQKSSSEQSGDRRLEHNALTDVRASAPTALAPEGDAESFDDWVTAEFPDPFAKEIPTAAGDDIALLIYTSGTTGTPKGVPLTHGNILAELDGIDEVLQIGENEKILSLLPLFHAYLQIVNMWVATTYGCETGYLKELSPAALGEAMKEFKPTILTTVPRLWYLFHKKIFDAVAAKPKAVQTLFKTMLAANGFSRDTLGVNLGRKLFSQVHESFGGNLRIAISAGSRFDEDVARDFHRLGFTILQGYGLTETSGAATATHEDDNRVGSVGKPMKGTEVKIAEPDKDGVGEVLIRGGIVFSGYYKNPEATAESFTEDGWFRSGDLGTFDKDGNLYIVGRGKDVIVLPSGKNVHPEDLEVHYLKTPLVEEMAIVGISDESAQRAGAEKLAAVVVPDFEYLRREHIANSKEAIRYALDNLGRELPEYQRVREYIVRAEPLPRTATRKIKRFELKKELENGALGDGGDELKRTWEFSAEDKALIETGAGAAVVAAVRQNARDADVIHPDMNLEIDLGLDSLGRAETFAALEHAFSTEFKAEDAATALTVREVIGLVSASLPEAAHAGVALEGAKASSAIVPANITLTNWSEIVRNTEGDFPEMRVVLRDRPIFIAFAFTVYKCFNLFCRVFMRLEVQNIEELRKMKRPFLICPNHQSFFDPFVLCSTYSYEFFRNTFHVGASMYFNGGVRQWLAEMLHVVPVDPDTQLMKAMRAGAIGLKNGKVLNIYPEGERAYDGELHPFKKGASILATELDLPILPVAMDGLHKVWARRSRKIRPAKVTIRFGEAFYVKDLMTGRNRSKPGAVATGVLPADQIVAGTAKESVSPDEVYEKATTYLRHTIAAMIEDIRNKTKKE